MMQEIGKMLGIFMFWFCLTACTQKLVELKGATNLETGLEAVVVSKETDATVDTPFEVYVVKPGEKASSDPVFRADKVENIYLEWCEPNQLIIHAKEARGFLHEKNQQFLLASNKNIFIKISLDIKKEL